jgi:hypothetical protein
VCTQRKDHVKTQGLVSIHKSRREAPEETNPADTFVWDFQLLEWKKLISMV